ncbi:hypothetical protein IJ847_00140, partial [Candidatus Saccharibacteria bacterium]|nr:hypothetical protein [Candidatus Saccharibacteria bacterium]
APKAPETPKPTTAQATEEVAKEETTAAESTEKPAPAPNPAPAIVVNHDASDEEIWQQITQHIQEKALPVLEYIHESDYQIVDKTLTIYAKKNFSKRQLDKKKSVILEVLPEGFTVEINDKTLMKDAEIAGIMELMGGGEEVQIDA